MELKLEPYTPTGSLTVCPKCTYQRRPTDTAPAWQCPGCKVAYAKVAPAATSDKQRGAPAMDEDAVVLTTPDSPLGTARMVVGALVLVMVVGAGWTWVNQRNAKKLQAEQALAAERQQAIDQAAGNLAADARLDDAANKLRSGRALEALPILKPMADQGDARAMLMMGMMLSSGYGGVAKDLEQAQQWLQKSAQNGQAVAWVWLGYLAEQRSGETGHMEAAANYYRKAAQAGNASGLYSLARLVDYGLGFAKDPARAYSLYALAAKAFNEDVRASERAPNDRTGLGSAAAMQRLQPQLTVVDTVRAEELAKTWQPSQPLP